MKKLILTILSCSTFMLCYSQYFFADTLKRDSMYYPVIREVIDISFNPQKVMSHDFVNIENRINFKGDYPDFAIGFSSFFDDNTGTIEKSYQGKNKFDTCLLKGHAIVFYNPFPHVYVYPSPFKDSNGINLIAFTSFSGINYSFVQRKGDILEMCISNDSILGTLKRYWYHSGVKKEEGYFWENKKNGIWKYWNENGKLYREEIWDKGILKDTKEIPAPRDMKTN